MNAPPAVSVVMPIRNVAATVLDTVDSILAQRFGDLELVVVDDGSSDGSAELVDGRNDPRVRLVRWDAPVGLVSALNRGVAEARGPLLARMDGDDTAHVDRIGRQVARFAQSGDLDVCDSRVEVFRDDGPTGGGYLAYQRWLDTIHTHGDFEREFLVENPVAHPAVMVRTEVLRSVGGYRDGPFPEDYDVWLRCLRAGARFHKIRDRLVRWRDHPARATRVDPRYARSAFFPLKWDHLLRTRLTDRPTVAVWGAGPTARPWLRALKQGGHPMTAVFDIDPRKIGRQRQSVPVLPLDQLTSVAFDLLLIAVGARGARDLIRARLATTPLTEVRDFLFVA